MSHCIRGLEADRLFLSNKEPRHSNFQEMDLKVEFSILSTAGTPTSASSCCFWLASQPSNWISCWTLSVGHTRLGAGGQAAALPAQPSPGRTLQWEPGTGTTCQNSANAPQSAQPTGSCLSLHPRAATDPASLTQHPHTGQSMLVLHMGSPDWPSSAQPLLCF